MDIGTVRPASTGALGGRAARTAAAPSWFPHTPEGSAIWTRARIFENWFIFILKKEREKRYFNINETVAVKSTVS